MQLLFEVSPYLSRGKKDIHELLHLYTYLVLEQSSQYSLHDTTLSNCNTYLLLYLEKHNTLSRAKTKVIGINFM